MDRDLDQWDAEIEADFQRTVAVARATGKAQQGRRYMGAPWAFWVALRAAKLWWVAVALGIYIYRRTKVTRSAMVTLPTAELAELGIDRYAKYRALRQLARAKLIRIERDTSGRATKVTLLWRGR